MSVNIVDLIKGHLDSSTVSQVASNLGENESGISKAISALLPAVVGGFANNSNNSTLLDSISDSSSGSLLNNILGGSTNNSLISTVISAIFGDKSAGLVNTISNFAGISNNSSNSLLNMVTGTVLGTVGKYASDNGLGSSGISSLLNDQKGIVSALLPAGLSLANLGLGHWFGGDKETVSSAPKPVYTERTTTKNNNENGGGMGWLKWLIPLILLLLIGGYLVKKCNSDKKAVTDTENMNDSIVNDTIQNTVDNDTATISNSRSEEEIDLNGTKLKAYMGGLEGQIVSYLKSGDYDKDTDAMLKDKWYTFDNVNFKMGSASELEAGSQVQLDNLVAILKAFPNAKIKIGGYTDKTGDAAKNKELSQQRADFIKKALGDAGVGGQVLSAEGYGSEFATVPAEATDEERAVDRKMAIRFAK